MSQDQVWLANGLHHFQQVLNLPAGHCFLWRGVAQQIICCADDVELTQVIQVCLNTVEHFALLHVCEGWSHRVWVVGLHLPMF